MSSSGLAWCSRLEQLAQRLPRRRGDRLVDGRDHRVQPVVEAGRGARSARRCRAAGRRRGTVDRGVLVRRRRRRRPASDRAAGPARPCPAPRLSSGGGCPACAHVSRRVPGRSGRSPRSPRVRASPGRASQVSRLRWPSSSAGSVVVTASARRAWRSCAIVVAAWVPCPATSPTASSTEPSRAAPRGTSPRRPGSPARRAGSAARLEAGQLDRAVRASAG